MIRQGINQLFRQFYRQRFRHIQAYMQNPEIAQEQVFKQLLQATKHTEWGKLYGYKDIRYSTEFSSRIPLQSYEDLKPYIQRMMHGEKDILWNGQVKWYSKSSGTTSDKSKIIPVSNQNLKHCHTKGNWDSMTLLYNQVADAKVFEGQTLLIGGSLERFEPYPRTFIGDVSAIMMKNMPAIARSFITPDIDTALLNNFEEKIERIAHIAIQTTDVRCIGGVPTWIVVLFRRMLELTGKTNILEIWPNFQCYIHGGVSFTPYEQQFKQFFPADNIIYQEVYNASEGYFAIQNDQSEKDMLLLLDNGIYYEFLPLEAWQSGSEETIPITEVEMGKNYALVVSTNAGLWRYMPGDTVMFTSIYPHKIKITGRTKHFINAFGEEVMIENTDKALAQTCQQLGTIVSEYTVAPIYFNEDGKGGHQWLIEFEQLPINVEQFAYYLDKNLQRLNSDYEAKRYKNMALERLKIVVLPPNTFIRWLKSKGKYGSQIKVPRLANNRNIVEEILQFNESELL